MPHTSEISPGQDSIAIVGGCGHVGLPLGMAFADKGFLVHLMDINAESVAMVNGGKMPFVEEGADNLLKEVLASGLLKATTDPAILREADVVIVTIGTPVDEYLDPSVSSFDESLHRFIGHIRPGQLLVLRSTVFPGVTDRLGRQLKSLGYTDADLAYCPERIVQGQSLQELAALPQLIGGYTEHAAERAAALFRHLSPSVIFLKPIEAELAKLYANAWRYINFAISNQFWVIAHEFGADFQKIHSALRQDYPRMKSFARAGFAAGPCLLKDTMQLGAFNHGSFILGQAAMMINEGLPYLLVQRIKQSFPISTMTVGVLGMAFKPNSDDMRSSLSYKLRKVLLLEAKEVLCADPYVPDSELVPQDEVLQKADLIIIGTPHDCYRTINFKQPVIDITSVIGKSA
ncbi:MAG: nucleotide sugar dehydrogenase [Candidatus Peribacteraceae bacterium]